MASGDGLISRLQQGFVLLVFLCAVDLAFALIHLVHTGTSYLGNPRFSLGHDLGYAEFFQYFKTASIVLLLAALWWRARQPVYAAWAALYAYLLGDDALQFHERGGEAVAGFLQFENGLGLRAVDYGELTVSAGLGLLVLMVIFFSYLKSAPAARHASQDLVLLLAGLVGFGVGVDMLHIVADGGRLGALLGLIEDGGEMVVVSFTLWYLYGLLACRGELPQPMWRVGWTAWFDRGLRTRPLTGVGPSRPTP